MAEQARLESARLYAELVDQEFQRQYMRRDRLDAKGQSLIGQTGAMLTLAAAVVAFLVSKDPLVVLKAPTSLFLGATLMLGLGAMAIGIHVSGNRPYKALGPGMLDQMAAGPQWADTEIEALQHICRIKREVTRGNDSRNKQLAVWLRIGQWGQIATIAAIVAGIISLARHLALSRCLEREGPTAPIVPAAPDFDELLRRAHRRPLLLLDAGGVRSAPVLDRPDRTRRSQRGCRDELFCPGLALAEPLLRAEHLRQLGALFLAPSTYQAKPGPSLFCAAPPGSSISGTGSQPCRSRP